MHGSITSVGAGAAIKHKSKYHPFELFPIDLTCGNPRTANEGVTGVPRVTPAVGDVVVDMTRGVIATHPRTRVNTVLVDTGQVAGTLSIDHTLWLTLHIGVTPVVSDTRAACPVTELIAHCINTTRRWVTRLYNNW